MFSMLISTFLKQYSVFHRGVVRLRSLMKLKYMYKVLNDDFLMSDTDNLLYLLVTDSYGVPFIPKIVILALYKYIIVLVYEHHC